MARRCLVIPIDLGTSSTTASYVLVRDTFDANGNQHREKYQSICDVRDWPGAHHGNANGDHCVPTELVYDKASRQLLCWGFDAKHYLDEPIPPNDPNSIFVVEHIKLLVPDPDEVKLPIIASTRYRNKREELIRVLKKHPHEVFQDFMTELVGHIIDSAKRRYGKVMRDLRIELVLAFPSGWPEHIHSKVARIGARAIDKAISVNHLQNITFGIEDVYTVSETLCGVKEWLRDNVADAAISVDLEQQLTNLDELKEGDHLLAVDIGGGTGCMTPLALIKKSPLGVDQIDQTLSLPVSGEAVQAEFELWLRSRITKKDFPGDSTHLINQICRKFKDEKTRCGHPVKLHSSTWNIPASGLRSNPSKGFEKDCMRIDRKFLDRCFDPIIDTLEAAIHDILRRHPGIKAIVFLGQFGGSSEYLRIRMEKSSISNLVKLWHSQSGKLNVVRGAMSERLSINSSFVRGFKTLKSYGTLISILYSPGSEIERIFPDPQANGAVPFERNSEGCWLVFIEWVFSKGSILRKGHIGDVARDRYHTWPRSEEAIYFEDTIVISDEVPPPPNYNGLSYTLWTEAHRNNQLIINNKRMVVQQIPFSWDLKMSQRIDPIGNFMGPYQRDDLETYIFPEMKRKASKRKWFRMLKYDLLWDITEMQVKVKVQAVFPGQTGPLMAQLAKERMFNEDERAAIGESRSKALIKDIEITENAGPRNGGTGSWAAENEARRNIPRSQPVDARHQFRSRSLNDLSRDSTQNILQPIGSSSEVFNSDGRRRDGCYTCKARTKKCGCEYVFDQKTGALSCKECAQLELVCHVTQESMQQRAKQIESKSRVKLGKRRAREESGSPSTIGRGRSITVNAFDTEL